MHNFPIYLQVCYFVHQYFQFLALEMSLLQKLFSLSLTHTFLVSLSHCLFLFKLPKAFKQHAVVHWCESISSGQVCV